MNGQWIEHHVHALGHPGLTEVWIDFFEDVVVDQWGVFLLIVLCFNLLVQLFKILLSWSYWPLDLQIYKSDKWVAIRTL